jgi:hypothetical protein
VFRPRQTNSPIRSWPGSSRGPSAHGLVWGLACQGPFDRVRGVAVIGCQELRHSRWVSRGHNHAADDCRQFFEVKFDDCAQLFRRTRALEALGQVVEPGAVFILETKQRGGGDCPTRRGRERGTGAAAGACWRSLARRRACRSAAVIGWGPRRGLGMVGSIGNCDCCACCSSWRDEATKAGQTIARIAVACAAGRDGFRLARWLQAHGIGGLCHPCLERGGLARASLVGERTRIINRIKGGLALLVSRISSRICGSGGQSPTGWMSIC